MQAYRKIYMSFWTGTTGQKLHQLGPQVQLIALYLCTNPHSNMLGIYYLPLVYLTHDTNLALEAPSKGHRSIFKGAYKGLLDLIDIGFCQYDHKNKYVWVVEMISYQIGKALKPNDKRITHIHRLIDPLPSLSFMDDFYNKYKEILYLNRDCMKPLTKPLQSQDQEQKQKQKQDQEQKQEQEQENIFVASQPRQGVSHTSPDNFLLTEQTDKSPAHDLPLVKQVAHVFTHWQCTMHHPQARLDDKRKRLIGRALRTGYCVAQLCDAINGCAQTPHNIGDNERGQRYDGLHIILRDGDQIDRFIHNAHNPPKPQNPADKKIQTNIQVMQAWLAEDLPTDTAEEK